MTNIDLSKTFYSWTQGKDWKFHVNTYFMGLEIKKFLYEILLRKSDLGPALKDGIIVSDYGKLKCLIIL